MTIKGAPTSLAEILATCCHKPQADADLAMAASRRNLELTKPPGSLGMLEDLAIWYASWRGDDLAGIERIQAVVFAGNHGISSRGVSAYPAEVTGQMVENFRTGGAAINQLVALLGGELSVIPLELEQPTRDFVAEPAMNESEMIKAFGTGWNAVDSDAGLLIVGEMGIGNTTSASAICLALFGGQPSDWAGSGTGISHEQLSLKTRILEMAMERHTGNLDCPLNVLQRLGGRELAAMTGAIASARHAGLPVILDGFICTSAASVLFKCNPDMLDHAVVGHVSAEQAHARLVNSIGMIPILDLGMRLGEGTGAAVAAHILKCAVACHVGMATFGEAGVSGG